MKILGIDPGTGIVGWGIVKREGTKCTPLKFGVIKTKSTDKMADRLKIIYDSISDIIKKEKPDAVAVEELFFFKNQKTIISVAQARGAIITAIRNSNIPVFEYTPLQIKQSITGYGRADKAQMQEMVRITLKLKEIPHPDDAADALAVAICHSQTNCSIVSDVVNNKKTV